MMGSGASAAAEKQLRIQSHLIDAELRREQRLQAKVIKMLLLGAADCGKSTIIKQMRLLHGEKFSPEEQAQQRGIIHCNVVQSITSIIVAMNTLSISYADGKNENRAKTVVDTAHHYDGTTPLRPEIVDAIKQLWADSGIKECVARSNEYQLNDSTQYFIENLERVMQPNYNPTDQDILHARVSTTGVVEFRFEAKEMKFRIFDVGGQRSERKKWIHCFDNVSAVIFISSLSEYDQRLMEDNETNRMHESLALFESICNSVFFANASILLFLNKKDLFAEKIKRVPLRTAFPEYQGPQSYEPCVEFISEKYLSLNRTSKRIYVSETCATDTQQMEFVLDSAMGIIISGNMKATGFQL